LLTYHGQIKAITFRFLFIY